MSISHYFEDLSKAYRAEIEDLQSDSEGKNVLAARLNQKRAQFASLMPMIEFAPEMVAPVFHGAVTFLDPHAMVLLSFAEPEEFPAWDEAKRTVRFEPWAQKLIVTVLQEPGGEQFLIAVICLEFLHARHTDRSTILQATGAEDDADADADGGAEANGDGERPDADDDEHEDLEEAGADWLADQGFDRRG